MAVHRRTSIKMDTINIFDLLNGDIQKKDCYEVENTIIMRGRLSEQEVNLRKGGALTKTIKLLILYGKTQV